MNSSKSPVCTCGHDWNTHGSDGAGNLTRCLYHHDPDRLCPCKVFVNRDFTTVNPAPPRFEEVRVNVEEFLKPDPNAPVIHGTRESPEVKHQFNITYEVPERLTGKDADEAYLRELADLTAVRETVDHPLHYGGADDPYEHIKVCEARGWGYHIGNCTKYLWRLGKKDPDELEDAKKALWYLTRYVERLEAERASWKTE